jgi:AAA+ superfamily predicted ATPase
MVIITMPLSEEISAGAFFVRVKIITSIQRTKVVLGVLSRDKINAPGVLRTYLASAGITCRSFSSNETTLSLIHSMLHAGERNDFMVNHCDILEHFGLHFLTDRYRRNTIEYEEMVMSGSIRKQALIKSSNALLCEDTLTPEVVRIYENPAKLAAKGHPVHYMIQTDDAEARRQMIEILLSALYDNGRIRSRRHYYVNVNNHKGLPWDQYDMLCRTGYNSAVVVDYRDYDEDECEYATPNKDVIDKLCGAIKRYRTNVLTVLCLPRSCEKVKDAFTERLGEITFIPLTEDTIFGKKAKSYLRSLAKKHSVPSDKALYKAVSDMEKGYLAADLNRAFDEWYGRKLKTQVYPQYAAFESASNQAVRQKPKGSAYADLEKMIGLLEAKAVITQAIDFHKAQRLFKDKGMPSDTTARHMVFTGNPGTAKTTAARLFAQIMKDNGLLSVGNLYEVGRADLVGKYVGWTAKIVKQIFKAAKGSVLFIDEAYSLVDDKDGLFGDEAINTIVQEMENNREDMVVIFAGYPDKMEGFLQKNPGLRSRIAFHVPFADYSPEELVDITRLLAQDKKITLAPDAEDKLLPIFAAHSEHDDFGNGRFARNLLEKAQMKQASRLLALDPSDVSGEDVCTLTAEDFESPETPPPVKEGDRFM